MARVSGRGRYPQAAEAEGEPAMVDLDGMTARRRHRDLGKSPPAFTAGFAPRTIFSGIGVRIREDLGLDHAACGPPHGDPDRIAQPDLGRDDRAAPAMAGGVARGAGARPWPIGLREPHEKWLLRNGCIRRLPLPALMVKG